MKNVNEIIYDALIKRGDVYEVAKEVSFSQPPLWRTLQKGQRLWVTDVCDFWPTMEKEEGEDYAFWGDFLNDFIDDGTLVKIENPEYPRGYYQSKYKLLKLLQEANAEREKLKKYKK